MNWKTKRKKAEAAGAPRSGPEGLDIIQDFVSTRRSGALEDGDLGTPDDLARWLVNRGLLPFEAELSEDDWKRAMALREAFYAQIRVNSGDSVASHELREIERVSHRSLFRICPDGPPDFEPVGEGLDRVFGTIALIVLRARREGWLKLLKVCSAEGCEQIYFDRSNGGVGKWCTRRCGSTMRGKVHRKTAYYKSRPKQFFRL